MNHMTSLEFMGSLAEMGKFYGRFNRDTLKTENPHCLSVLVAHSLLMKEVLSARLFLVMWQLNSALMSSSDWSSSSNPLINHPEGVSTSLFFKLITRSLILLKVHLINILTYPIHLFNYRCITRTQKEEIKTIGIYSGCSLLHIS